MYSHLLKNIIIYNISKTTKLLLKIMCHEYIYSIVFDK